MIRRASRARADAICGPLVVSPMRLGLVVLVLLVLSVLPGAAGEVPG